MHPLLLFFYFSYFVRNTETLIHILKGCLGTGVLCMPQGFQYVGTVAGIIGLAFLGFFAGYCIYLLVNRYNFCILFFINLYK